MNETRAKDMSADGTLHVQKVKNEEGPSHGTGVPLCIATRTLPYHAAARSHAVLRTSTSTPRVLAVRVCLKIYMYKGRTHGYGQIICSSRSGPAISAALACRGLLHVRAARAPVEQHSNSVSLKLISGGRHFMVKPARLPISSSLPPKYCTFYSLQLRIQGATGFTSQKDP